MNLCPHYLSIPTLTLKKILHICLPVKSWFLWDRTQLIWKQKLMVLEEQWQSPVTKRLSSLSALPPQPGLETQLERWGHSIMAPSQKLHLNKCLGQLGPCSSCSHLQELTFSLTCPLFYTLGHNYSSAKESERVCAGLLEIWLIFFIVALYMCYVFLFFVLICMICNDNRCDNTPMF